MNIEISFTSALYINDKRNPTIIAIVGYEYNEKNQISSIETYDITKNIWSLNNFQDLNVLLYNENIIFFLEVTIKILEL